MRLCLWNAATYGPTVHPKLTVQEYVETGGRILTRKNWITRRKLCPSAASLLDWLCRRGETSQNSSQQRVYCSSSRLYVRAESHGDDTRWIKLLTRPPHPYGKPTRIIIWEQVREMDVWVIILPVQDLKYLKGLLTCRKILWNGASSFTSHPKKGLLRMFFALKNPSPPLGLNLWPVGPVTSTLTPIPPRPLVHDKYRMDWAGRKPGPQRWEPCD
jgi:hypothetical protein